MGSLTGWSALTILIAYLLFFFWGNALASRSAGRSIWLFSRARGRDRLAAIGFRLSFVIALLGSMLWLTIPSLRRLDPLSLDFGFPFFGLIGVLIAASGAMIAFAAQISMGISWRVGVVSGETGPLVANGLYRYSRNPTFVGQLALLAGLMIALPSSPTLLAVILFYWSASAQIRSEEAALQESHGSNFIAYRNSVPRWLGWPLAK